MTEIATPSALDEAKRAQIDGALAALVDSGDLDRVVSLARLVGSAQDAVTDDIVGRVATLAADGADLVDRVNRSGVARALPAIAELVENGDLDRVVQLARLIGSAQDAMTDDIVGRVATVAADGVDLVDRINRSGAVKSLPAIGALVESGDLDRVVELARLVGSAQDAMTDEMIVRLAGVASHGLSLVENVTRTGLADQLIKLASHLERSGLAQDLLNAVDSAAQEVAAAPAPKGGLSGLMGIYAMLKRPDAQRAIHFAIAMLCALCQARVAPHVKGA